jgi:hypothetical protein
MRRCVAATEHWSRAASELTRDVRQPVGPVEPKGCLSRIPLWRSNKLLKWNELKNRDSWAEKNCGEEFELLLFK